LIMQTASVPPRMFVYREAREREEREPRVRGYLAHEKPPPPLLGPPDGPRYVLLKVPGRRLFRMCTGVLFFGVLQARPYMGNLLIRNTPAVGPYGSPTPRDLW
jgi:hypothetical protein